ncbi:hypothetical protein QCA50_014704 [Cerrena zonata]|uniref:Uncharacterized protein n=1 Tax=Cerrena zonata TaxID=2478898 RepID=A0AAW0FK94_9APHY
MSFPVLRKASTYSELRASSKVSSARPLCPPVLSSVPVNPVVHSLHRSKSFSYDRMWLTVPVYYYRRHQKDSPEPHCFQIDPLLRLNPMLFLTCPIVLQLPLQRWSMQDQFESRSQATGHIIGIEDATLHHVTFTLVVLFDGALQLVRLIASRLRIHSFRIPSLVVERQGCLRWPFLTMEQVRTCVRALDMEMKSDGDLLSLFDSQLLGKVEALRFKRVSAEKLLSISSRSSSEGSVEAVIG